MKVKCVVCGKTFEAGEDAVWRDAGWTCDKDAAITRDWQGYAFEPEDMERGYLWTQDVKTGEIRQYFYTREMYGAE